jgi:hypothetical protein
LPNFANCLLELIGAAMTSTMTYAATRFESLDCTITIGEPAPGVVLMVIEGADIGQLGEAPFRAMAQLLGDDRRVELFIDARHARGPSMDVSGDWALWLGRHRNELRHISLLAGSRFVQLTADFVRRFAELGDVMRIYTEASVFEGALSNALGNAVATRD